MTNLESLKPLPPWEFEDHSDRIALHEAAHCVAAYLFGREIHSVKIRMRAGRTMVARTDDVFASAVGLVVGEAFERNIGLAPMALNSHGSTRDLDNATKLLATQCSGAALDAACRVVEEAAIELASSERFHKLAFALAARIVDEPVLSPREIRETLERADPERPQRVERHSRAAEPTIAPWYQVFVGNKMIYDGHSQTEAHAIRARTPGAMSIGSIYG